MSAQLSLLGRSRHLCNTVGRSPRQLAAWVIGLILLGIKKYVETEDDHDA